MTVASMDRTSTSSEWTEADRYYESENEDMREKYKIDFDWMNYPEDRRRVIFDVEHNAYQGVINAEYNYKREKLITPDVFLMRRMTIFFMMFIVYRKHKVDWSRCRNAIELFMMRTGEHRIDYKFFQKYYRDNPVHFEPFYIEFCEKFCHRFRLVNYDKLNPVVERELKLNQGGQDGK